MVLEFRSQKSWNCRMWHNPCTTYSNFWIDLAYSVTVFCVWISVPLWFRRVLTNTSAAPPVPAITTRGTSDLRLAKQQSNDPLSPWTNSLTRRHLSPEMGNHHCYHESDKGSGGWCYQISWLRFEFEYDNKYVSYPTHLDNSYMIIAKWANHNSTMITCSFIFKNSKKTQMQHYQNWPP